MVDAILTAPMLESPAHLSLAPTFQRQWGRIYDALNAGTMHLTALEELVAQYPLPTAPDW